MTYNSSRENDRERHLSLDLSHPVHFLNEAIQSLVPECDYVDIESAATTAYDYFRDEISDLKFHIRSPWTKQADLEALIDAVRPMEALLVVWSAPFAASFEQIAGDKAKAYYLEKVNTLWSLSIAIGKNIAKVSPDTAKYLRHAQLAARRLNNDITLLQKRIVSRFCAQFPSTTDSNADIPPPTAKEMDHYLKYACFPFRDLNMHNVEIATMSHLVFTNMPCYNDHNGDSGDDNHRNSSDRCGRGTSIVNKKVWSADRPMTIPAAEVRNLSSLLEVTHKRSGVAAEIERRLADCQHHAEFTLHGKGLKLRLRKVILQRTHGININNNPIVIAFNEDCCPLSADVSDPSALSPGVDLTDGLTQHVNSVCREDKSPAVSLSPPTTTASATVSAAETATRTYDDWFERYVVGGRDRIVCCNVSFDLVAVSMADITESKNKKRRETEHLRDDPEKGEAMSSQSRGWRDPVMLRF